MAYRPVYDDSDFYLTVPAIGTPIVNAKTMKRAPTPKLLLPRSGVPFSCVRADSRHIPSPYGAGNQHFPFIAIHGDQDDDDDDFEEPSVRSFDVDSTAAGPGAKWPVGNPNIDEMYAQGSVSQQNLIGKTSS